MIPFGPDTTIGVVGAGAMGTGIAQLAALKGHAVILADTSRHAISRAWDAHAKGFGREVEKGRLTRQQVDAAIGRIRYEEGGPTTPELFSSCGLVIEAIVE